MRSGSTSGGRLRPDHTQVIAPSGDRDGLPNVIGEAMAAGVPVVTSPTAATTEAVSDGVTGLVIAVDQPAAWRSPRCAQLSSDDAFSESLRRSARSWVESHFDVKANTQRLLQRFEEAGAP